MSRRDACHAKRARWRTALLLLLAMTFPLASSAADPEWPVAPAASAWIGPYAASDFTLTSGDGAPLRPPAKLYFAKEWIAVPRPGVPVAGFGEGVTAFSDVGQWSARATATVMPARPALVWVAAPQLKTGVRLAEDAKSITAGGTVTPFELVPKLDLNRSYFDASSTAFFAQRLLTVRGEMKGATFW